jgi:hypothetical protein
MNERIKELAEQAGIAVWGDAVYMYHPSETLDSTVMTKFAELIIRECAEVCYDHSRAAGGVDTDFGYGYKDCGDDIKRNFGVEL